MNNFKWGVFAAAVSFIISFGLGLVSGVNIIHILLRALVFSTVFFGIGFGLKFIIDTYLPEVLFISGDSEKQENYSQDADSQLSITLDTTGEYAVPELYKTPGEEDQLGDIDDLISGNFKPRPEGIDRKPEEGYNNKKAVPDFLDMEPEKVEDFPVFQKQEIQKPVFTPSFGDDSDGLGGLPDLDAMAMAFSTGGGGVGVSAGLPESAFESDFPPMEEESEQPRYVDSNKSQPLKGDYNPKELAEGIRTVLSKDK